MDRTLDLQHEITLSRSELRPYVRHMLHTCSHAASPYSVRVPPSGAIYLTFNYGAVQDIQFGGQPPRRLPRLFVGGQLRREMPRTEIHGRVGLTGVEFTATGFYRLFRVDCQQLTDRATAFSDVVGAAEAEALEGALIRESSPAGRLDRLQQYLMGRVPDAGDSERADRAIQLIERAGGRIPIDDVARRCAVSHRQLNRIFATVVGISPKHYSKIIQIRQVLAALGSDDHETLLVLANNAGYYDQAHLIKDFQRLVGTNPLGFLDHPDGFLKSFLTRT